MCLSLLAFLALTCKLVVKSNLQIHPIASNIFEVWIHVTCTCFLQMAARETGFGQVEQYMHAGKLLALELLVRVFENPHHHWSTLRPEVRKSSVFASPHVTTLIPGSSAWPTFLDLLLPCTCQLRC